MFRKEQRVIEEKEEKKQSAKQVCSELIYSERNNKHFCV